MLSMSRAGSCSCSGARFLPPPSSSSSSSLPYEEYRATATSPRFGRPRRAARDREEDETEKEDEGTDA
jgi:hypothetical protein